MTDPNTDPTVEPRDAPPRGGEARKVPPLAWIILGLLVLMAILALVQCQGTHETPGGGTIPQSQSGDQLVMPQPAVNDPLTPPPAATGTETPATNANPASAPANSPG